jgi:hypothetical protein
MKSIFRLFLIAGSVAFVAAGCATGPAYRDVASSIPTLAANHGRIYFFRSGSMFGAAIQPDVQLNGQVVGQSKPKGFFYVDEPAGQYTAATTSETEKTVSFSLEAGETKYVRTSASLGIVVYRIVPSLESADIAVKEIEDSKYTGTMPVTK